MIVCWNWQGIWAAGFHFTGRWSDDWSHVVVVSSDSGQVSTVFTVTAISADAHLLRLLHSLWGSLYHFIGCHLRTRGEGMKDEKMKKKGTAEWERRKGGLWSHTPSQLSQWLSRDASQNAETGCEGRKKRRRQGQQWILEQRKSCHTPTSKNRGGEMLHRRLQTNWQRKRKRITCDGIIFSVILLMPLRMKSCMKSSFRQQHRLLFSSSTLFIVMIVSDGKDKFPFSCNGNRFILHHSSCCSDSLSFLTWSMMSGDRSLFLLLLSFVRHTHAGLTCLMHVKLWSRSLVTWTLIHVSCTMHFSSEVYFSLPSKSSPIWFDWSLQPENW